MKKKILPCLAVSALAALSLTSAPAAFASDISADIVAEGQAVDATKSLAAGVLRDDAGRPLADAEVKVFAFPEKISSAEGSSFDLVEIGATKSDAKGNYDVTPDYSALGASLSRNKAEVVPVNISIVASTADSDTIFPTTVWVARGGEEAFLSLADLADTAPANFMKTKSAMAESKGTSSPILDLQLSPKVKASTLEASGAGLVQPLAGVPGNCRVTTNYGPRLVTVGQVSSTTSGGFNKVFKYSAASNSTLGIGVSNTGAYGSFSLSGSTTVSSNASVTFPAITTATSKFYRTNFNYSKLACSYGTANPVIKYEMRAISYAAGSASAAATAPSATACIDNLAGTTFVKSSSTATSFSAGAKTASAIGIDLLSRTGYTTATTVTIKFTAKKKLCGHQGLPGSTPGLLVVKP